LPNHRLAPCDYACAKNLWNIPSKSGRYMDFREAANTADILHRLITCRINTARQHGSQFRCGDGRT
jgi:hypothetical protein